MRTLVRRVMLLLPLAAASCGSSAPAGSPSATPAAADDPTGPAKPAGAAAPGAAAITSQGSGPGCEEARLRWQAEVTRPAAPEPPANLVQGLTAKLNDGTYLSTCAVPQSAGVSVCAAVLARKVAGVTVVIEGGSQPMADCVARAVEAMSFDEYPDMLLARTTFAASP